MKLLIVSFLMFSATAMAAVNVPDSELDGAGDAGGGDAYSLEFSLLGHQAAKIVRSAKLDEVDSKDFAKAVEEVRVTSEDYLYLKGVEVDAINYPSQKMIQISRTRWDQLQDMSERKFKLVVHEYLSVMGLNDANYSLTEKIFASSGEPVLSVICTTMKSPKGQTVYGINLFKSAPAEVLQGLNPQEVSSGATKVSYPALTSGFNPSPSMKKTNQVVVTFLAGLTNITIPLTFTSSAQTHLESTHQRFKVKKIAPGSTNFNASQDKVLCRRVQ